MVSLDDLAPPASPRRCGRRPGRRTRTRRRGCRRSRARAGRRAPAIGTWSRVFSRSSLYGVRQHAEAGLVEPVEEHGAGLGRVDHQLLVVVVHGRLGRRHHARAHLHALGAEHERGRHRSGRRRCRPRRSPGTSTLRAHQRQQHHRRDVAAALEAAALAALGDDAVDARVDRLQRRRAGWARRGTR